MILFPRRADKPKKGEIDDSTADRLASADATKQVTDKHVLPKSKPVLREKAVKLTKELKEAKAYRKLRQIQINKKYKGKREKRAKEAAEKEAEKKK